MSVQKLQELVDQYPYVDARAKKLECNYFGDEITLVYESTDEKDVCCQFIGCFNVIFDHDKIFDKLRPVKDMNYVHMPYFMFNITVGEVLGENRHFYTCKIDMGLLQIEICCEKIIVTRIDALITDGKKSSEF